VLECHVTGDLIFVAPPDAIPTGPATLDVVPAVRNVGSTWMGTETTLRELRLRRIPLPTSALFPRRRLSTVVPQLGSQFPGRQLPIP
jgi:hypothetical protein